MRRFRTSVVTAALGIGAVVTSPLLQAQIQRPKAELTPIAANTPVRTGTAATLTLKVRLPTAMHVQSDKPRTPSLIPTVLTIEPPQGVRIDGIAYPPAEDFVLSGQSAPLAVFGSEFTIEVRVTIDASAARSLTVPARLRYQACDKALCYPPVRADVRWTLTVVD
jgi:hypothetical protein